MSYVNIVSANELFKKGYTPEVFNGSNGVVAGYGTFSHLHQEFEFPLRVEKTNKSITLKPWNIDETKVIYTSIQNNGQKNIIHTNITELSYLVAPFIHLFDFDKISKKINNNEVFSFIDEATNCFIKIIPETKFYKN